MGSFGALTLTFGDWNAIRPDGVYVLDPDGFDRSAPDFWTRRYTREEWLERAVRGGSTMRTHLPDHIERLLTRGRKLEEFYAAYRVLDDGITDFDLRNEAVERFRRAEEDLRI